MFSPKNKVTLHYKKRIILENLIPYISKKLISQPKYAKDSSEFCARKMLSPQNLKYSQNLKILVPELGSKYVEKFRIGSFETFTT